MTLNGKEQEFCDNIRRDLEEAAVKVSSEINVLTERLAQTPSLIRSSARWFGKSIYWVGLNLRQHPIYNHRKKTHDLIRFSDRFKIHLVTWGKGFQKEHTSQITNKLLQFETKTNTLISEFKKIINKIYGLPSDVLVDKCPFCQKPTDEDSIFCKYCGAQIKGKSRYIPANIKEEVMRRDKGMCVICGSGENIEFDHIIPFSKGGSNSLKNIQILCERCNRKKHNKIGF